MSDVLSLAAAASECWNSLPAKKTKPKQNGHFSTFSTRWSGDLNVKSEQHSAGKTGKHKESRQTERDGMWAEERSKISKF